MPTLPRIVISAGEPSGIGPDITIKIAQSAFAAELVVIADPTLLTARAQQLNLPLSLVDFEPRARRTTHKPGSLKISSVALNTTCEAGKLNTANAAYVIRCLEQATDLCLQKTADALVTAPVQKSILNEAGFSFTGHTEFLAARCHANDVIMLFVTPSMKVALATTHLPLASVPSAITTQKLLTTLRLLSYELTQVFHIKNPHILVCGLNPHAGENGHLGREEIEIMAPAIYQLQNENINVTGPLPADTIFTEKYLATADAMLAMYHDQALPVVKSQGFHQAVNVTLGLPIIRTSVDHGTALDIAGTTLADSQSLACAIQLAIDLVKTRENNS